MGRPSTSGNPCARGAGKRWPRTDGKPVPRRRPAGGLLRTRNFALLWAGQSTSAVGSAITTMALPLLAISTLHAGPGMVALLTAATWLPWLLIGLLAGVWVDRWPRRRTLLIADIVSAAVLVVIPIAAWTNVLSMTILYTIAPLRRVRAR